MIVEPDAERIASRGNEILREHQRRLYGRTDRMFAVLMILQWAAVVVASLWLTPKTWLGATSALHPHVVSALLFGGVLCVGPVWLAWRHPGDTITRHVMAIAQVLFSSLAIHISGGRIETHFHVFGSLAFLAAYRDWRVLIPATAIVAVDHLVRGFVWPETVYGIATVSLWRSIEHAAWVVFEDVFLIINIRQGVIEMRSVALQTARLEDHAELKNYAEQLASAFEKERAIIDGALDALVETDRRGSIIGWNQQAEQAFGWSAEEALGQMLTELIIPEQHRQAHATGLQKYCETDHGPALRQRHELEALHRDGHSFPIELAVTPVHQGEEQIFCAFVRDITVRIQHERELRHAIRQAEAASRIKSQFLANMSHEIRTPLNGILGFTDLLMRNADNGDECERRDYLETIRNSGRHLLHVINDILDLSKIEAGLMQVECIPFSPDELIAEVASALRVRANAKGVLLECRWDGAIPATIESDPHRFRQVLMNLVGNAVKFTDRGSVAVVASIAHKNDVAHWVVKVSDTGIGISAEQLEGLFKPFVQADSSMTRKFGGTGLGLAISKSIAEALGGELTVESEPGRGSTFIATIRVGNLRDVRMHKVACVAPFGDFIDSHESNASLEGVRVLLADDGETNRKLVQLFLKRHGAEVCSVENGELACEAAASQIFDVVLMDMQMPVLDGYAATRKLRSRGFDAPIIALTAHAMTGDREKCEQAGCSGYLTKPVDMDELIRQVHAAAPASRRRSLPAAAVAPAPMKRQAGVVDEPIYSELPTDDDQIREIVADFAATIPERLDAIERALDELDFPTVASLAHGLKGAGGTAGFPALTDLSLQLEAVITRQQREAAAELVDQLRSVQSRIVV